MNNLSDWANLPEVILGHIFSFLPTTDRLIIANVCPNWSLATLRPDVWHDFVYIEDSWTSMEEHYLHVSSYENTEIDLLCTTLNFKDIIINRHVNIIKKFGKHFRHVTVGFKGPDSNEVMNSLSQVCSNITCLKIKKLRTQVHVIRNHDSSCKQAVYTLLQRNHNLQKLEIRDFDSASTNEDLPLGPSHASSLRSLHIFNSFKKNNLSRLMYLVNLRELAIEPKFLSYSLLLHLAGNSLTELNIVALENHLEFYNEALQNWQWQNIRSQGPDLRVNCYIGHSHDWSEKEIFLKEKMPVKCLVYLKYLPLNYCKLSPLVSKYGETLEVFIDFSISKKSYEDEYDIETNFSIFNAVIACPRLVTIAVKEMLLSWIILAMLSVNRNLVVLLMDRQVSYTTDGLAEAELPLSPEVKVFIRQHSSSKEDFVQGVFEITGKYWLHLTEKDIRNELCEKCLRFF